MDGQWWYDEPLNAPGDVDTGRARWEDDEDGLGYDSVGSAKSDDCCWREYG